MLISIITPVLNGAAFIGETVESVLAQTYTDWEMIVMDDGSTDSTAEIIKSYALKDSRIHYLYQPNGGMGKARNEAIKQAEGQYLAFLDADDLWTTDKLTKQAACANETNADLIYTAGFVFNSHINNITREVDVPTGFQVKSDFFIKQLYGFTVPVLSVMVKKDWVTKIGGFEESKKSHFAADYQLWLRLMDHGVSFFGMKEKLFYYRQHASQATANDGLALNAVIWALHLAKLKSVSNSTKRKIMKQRINRFIIHELESVSSSKLNEMMQLFLYPLRMYAHFIFVKILFMFGHKITKHLGYRFLDLSENLKFAII